MTQEVWQRFKARRRLSTSTTTGDTPDDLYHHHAQDEDDLQNDHGGRTELPRLVQSAPCTLRPPNHHGACQVREQALVQLLGTPGNVVVSRRREPVPERCTRTDRSSTRRHEGGYCRWWSRRRLYCRGGAAKAGIEETFMIERKMDNCKPCGGAVPLCMIDEFDCRARSSTGR